MAPTAARDPEREVVRRVLPFALPAFLIALFGQKYVIRGLRI